MKPVTAANCCCTGGDFEGGSCPYTGVCTGTTTCANAGGVCCSGTSACNWGNVCAVPPSSTTTTSTSTTTTTTTTTSSTTTTSTTTTSTSTTTIPCYSNPIYPNTTQNKAYYSGILTTENLINNFDSATNELTDANYKSVNSSDGGFFNQSVTGSKTTFRAITTKYTFNLSAYNTSPNVISNITYCYTGGCHDDFEDVCGAENPLYFYNVTLANWVKHSDTDNTNNTYCKTFSNIADIFNSTSGLTMIGIRTMGWYNYEVGGGAVTVTSFNDLANVTVTYGTGCPTTSTTTTTTIPVPQYSSNSTNSTLAGKPIEHRSRWTDNVGLSGYIFSFWNGSDSYRTPTSVYSFCGEDASYGFYANNTIDGDLTTDWEEREWDHEHWIIYDLGLRVNVTSIRIYSPDPSIAIAVPCSINAIYVSDDPTSLGSSLGSCILPAGSLTWRECALTTPKTGRYVKITLNTTDADLNCGAGVFNHYIGYFYEFQAKASGFINDTWTSMTGTGNWSNVTKTVNSTEGATIRWQVYANNTNNVWNVSPIYSYITTKPHLIVTLSSPSPSVCTLPHPCNWVKNSAYSIRAAVECSNGPCGNVYGTVRYNASSSSPDTLLNTTIVSCGNMNENDICQLNWTVNVTGNIGVFWKVDVNTSSSFSDISSNDTNDAIIKIATSPNLQISGIALYYYTGERVNGNVTVIPVENSSNKATSLVTNGEWYVDFSIGSGNIQHYTVIIDDNQKIGYNEIKTSASAGSEPNCSTQYISLSGYSVDVNSGNSITSGNIRISVLDTDYTNTTTFSGTWSVDLHPCLVSGKVYTLYILISDMTGKRGEFFQKYPAK